MTAGGSRRQLLGGTEPQITAQLGGQGEVLRDPAVDLPGAPSGYVPDLAVTAPGAAPGGDGRWAAADLEAVLDVLPRPAPGPDLAGLLRLYAASGVPVYVAVDPAAAACTVHTEPQRPGAYRLAEKVPFGEDLHLQLAGRTLVIDTAGLPADPARPARGRRRG
ncbi:hypothetical protein KNE206_14630 [Kitasatospora sp. NE20-6]|uniref:Uma2 family endonuclease n=1 Tax=Kitasatospora sp. NE20-6 TaxID=2859066 RepID=UPI0034DCBA92